MAYTPVVPLYFAIGDYWPVGVQFVDPATDLPIPISSSLVPDAEFYQAYSTGPALDLTIANGGATVIDGPNGKVVFTIPLSATANAVPQRAPLNPFAPQNYPTRLQCRLTDGIGPRTYAIVAIVPVDPRTTDLSTLPANLTVIAYTGPAGAQGPVGPAGLTTAQITTLVNQIVAEALAGYQPGGTSAALAGNVIGTGALSGSATEQSPGSDALAGNVPGTASLGGSPTEQAPGTDALGGGVPGSATLSGVMTANDAGSGSMPGSAGLGGSLTQQVPGTDALGGAVPGSGALSGNATEVDALTGTIPGSSGALAGSMTQSSSGWNDANSWDDTQTWSDAA